MECLWIVLIIFFYDKVKAETDPCSTYQNVSDTDLQNDFSNSKCFPNSTTPTWYRFTSNAAGTMHTDCKSASTCGGSGQVWINGTLPTYNDGTTQVFICIKMGSCCNQRNMIAVRNCNSFFVFELRKLPTCGVRYCFNKNDAPLVTVATTTSSTTSTTESTSKSYTSARKATTSSTLALPLTTSTSYKTTRESTTSISTPMSTASTPVTISKPTSTQTTSTFITLLTTISNKASISSRLSSKSMSSIRPTTIPSYSRTLNTQVTLLDSRMTSYTTRTRDLDKTLSTSTFTRSKRKTKDADETTLVIAICGSSGALLLVAVIFIVLFRVCRSKLQHILPDEHQSLPECHDMARNVKFDAGHLQSRTHISA